MSDDFAAAMQQADTDAAVLKIRHEGAVEAATAVAKAEYAAEPDSFKRGVSEEDFVFSRLVDAKLLELSPVNQIPRRFGGGQ